MSERIYPAKPTAYMLAIFVSYLWLDFEKAHSRTISRFRIAIKTLRKLSKRSRISEEFMAEIIDELGNMGWSAFVFGEFLAVVASDVVEKWPRASDVRAGDELETVENESSPEFKAIATAVEKRAKKGR
jgi:hypothetical protein